MRLPIMKLSEDEVSWKMGRRKIGLAGDVKWMEAIKNMKLERKKKKYSLRL